MNKALIAVLFGVSVIGASVASSSILPVAYGAGEMTPGVGITSIVGTITALLSGAGGIWSLFKTGTVSDFAKGALKNLTEGDAHGTGVDAAFIAIVTAVLLKKKTIDPALLSEIGAVRNKVQTELDAK